MADTSCDWIVLRDGPRTLVGKSFNDRDRLAFVAALSSDPRNINELAIAWSRYRPDQPLLELPWNSSHDLAVAPATNYQATNHQAANHQAADGKAAEDSIFMGYHHLDKVPGPDIEWLVIDLRAQCYAWHDTEDPQSLASGAYVLDRSIGKDGDVLWINIPPWWRRLESGSFSDGLSQPPVTQESLDFRSVLFGRELVKDIAQRVLAVHWSKNTSGTATDGGASPTLSRSQRAAQGIDDRLGHASLKPQGLVTEGKLSEDDILEILDDNSEEDQQIDRQVLKEIRRIHALWLMTGRESLGGATPRDFLHMHREWKEREMDFRRSQWSRTRMAPPPVPESSHVYRYGPVGLEEVVLYFDLCRDLITAAWRWVDDDPQIQRRRLVRDLEQMKDGWLGGEDPGSGGMSLQEVLDAERKLMPRLAGDDPIDCDCPLCRMQKDDAQAFGPAFMMVDGFHLEMEDEFAFSLATTLEQWQESREMLGNWSDEDCVDDEEGEEELVSVCEEDGDGRDRGSIGVGVGVFADASGDLTVGGSGGVDQESLDRKVWKSSMVSATMNSPQLSLFAVGARLAELISDLKSRQAPRALIDQLNEAFDELARVIRQWLVAQATRQRGDEPVLMGGAVEQMIASLESVTTALPELTAQSADLQSLVHEWQRQLLASSRQN